MTARSSAGATVQAESVHPTPIPVYWRGWRRIMRAIVVGLAAVGIVVTTVGASFYAAYHRTVPDGVRSVGVNALWMGHRWVGEAHDEVEFGQLAEKLHSRAISDVFVHVGPIAADGTIPAKRFPFAQALIATLHRRVPQLRIQAWMGQNEAARGGPLDLDNERVRSRIVDTAEELLELGFDGIHFDIEPIFPGDDRFLSLLAATHRRTIDHGAVLSVATMELEPLPGAAHLGRRVVARYHAWTRRYYERLAEHVDQLAVMTYDSAMPTDWLYGAVVRQQTSELARLLPDHVTLFIGIPTYGEGNLGHWPKAENMRSGIRGVRLGLADVSDDDRAHVGVAVYADWTTNDSEWTTFERDWLGRER